MKLQKEQFDVWCDRLQLSAEACRYIMEIRSSNPSRAVGGGRRSVSGRFPSRKMQFTIQFESHKVELPLIYTLEHDSNVLEFYDQPPSIKLSYQSTDGRNQAHYYTPDFFVIRTDSAGWIECKPEEELHRLSEKNPNRYALVDDEKWHMLPGEHFATQFGLWFEVWSSAEINWNLQRNLEFLQDYYA